MDQVDSKLRELKELLSQLELQAEQTKAQIDRAKPQPFYFRDGELRLENSSAWPKFNSSSGALAFLGFGLDPLPSLHGQAQVELIGAVAVDRLLPQQEVKMEAAGQRVALRKAEVRYEGDWVMTRAFREISRPELFEDGDMFYIFPGADNPEKAFRQSGRSVPNGFQFLVKDGPLKGIEAWAGDELVYGAAPMGLLRLRRDLGPLQAGFLAQWVQDAAMVSGKDHETAQGLWLGLPLFAGLKLDLAGLRRPTRVGQSYTVVTETAPGGGTAGTNYLVESKATTDSDALGAALRLQGFNSLPGLEQGALSAEYTGPLAGNRTRLAGLLALRPFRYLLLSAEAAWQKPLVGVNPTVIIGTPSLNLGKLPGTGPRPYGSPVTVSQDPISGVNNREMTELKATLEIHPGQGWFYRYRPRIVEAWNFNPDLQTPLSNALSLRYYNFPTGSDLHSYIDATGNRVAEGASGTGLAPTNGWRYELKDILAFGALGLRGWLALATGDQSSGLSPNSSVVAANQYFAADLTLRALNLTLSGGYAEDVYGPDDWYQVFGVIIGNRYRASLSYAFGPSEISVKYEGWRDKDGKKYHNPVNTVVTANGTLTVEPPIDQVFTSYALRF